MRGVSSLRTPYLAVFYKADDPMFVPDGIEAALSLRQGEACWSRVPKAGAVLSAVGRRDCWRKRWGAPYW
jgi:hypothetical protein